MGDDDTEMKFCSSRKGSSLLRCTSFLLHQSLKRCFVNYMTSGGSKCYP